jgi:hypothetical protein
VTASKATPAASRTAKPPTTYPTIQGRPVQVEPSFSVDGVSPGVGLAATAVGVGLAAGGVAVAVFVAAGVVAVVATVGEVDDVGEGEVAARVAVGATVPGEQAMSTAI